MTAPRYWTQLIEYIDTTQAEGDPPPATFDAFVTDLRLWCDTTDGMAADAEAFADHPTRACGACGTLITDDADELEADGEPHSCPLDDAGRDAPPIIRALVNAGHDEYALVGEGVTCVWGGDVFDTYDEPNDDDAWASMGVAPEERIDADLSWQHVYRIEATRQDLTRAFLGLLTALSQPPGGDDDTFDYYPSGARLALAVARLLGAPWPAATEQVIRTAIGEKDDDAVATEVLDSIGLA